MDNSEPNSSESIIESIGPGAQLKAKREAGGHSLETVAKDTRIPRVKLVALEEDDYPRVGAGAFITGYIRAYAKWLGIDADPLVGAYEKTGNQEPGQYQNFVNQTVEREPGKDVPAKRLPLVWLIGGVLVLWVAAALVLNGDKTTHGREDSTAEVQQELPSEEAEASQPAEVIDSPEAETEAETETEEGESPPQSNPSTEPDNLGNTEADPAAATEAPTAATDTLTFGFTGDCWVEVHDASGEVLFAQLQQAGDNLQLSGQAPFSVMLGNARVVTLAVNGQEIDTNPGPNRDTLRLRVGP